MADETTRFTNQAQDLSRIIYEAIQGMAQMQFNVLQRLAEVQRAQLSQAAEVARNQLQLIATARQPQEFAAAQMDLAKEYGQKYADSMQETMDIVIQAWREYGERLAQATTILMGGIQQEAGTATGQAKEAAESTKKGTSSTKTP